MLSGLFLNHLTVVEKHRSAICLLLTNKASLVVLLNYLDEWWWKSLTIRENAQTSFTELQQSAQFRVVDSDPEVADKFW